MPSTLVHLAIGALVGTALLGDRFSPRAIAAVLVATAVPDLDTFLFFLWAGAHRTLFHSFVFPAVLAAGLYWDTRRRRASLLRDRFGPNAGYVAVVALVSMVAGGLLPDMFTNGVNALWPFHDQFYTVNGKLLISDQRGIVQTFVDLSPTEPAQTTKNARYSTGVDPAPWKQPEKPPERIFPVVMAGWQLLLVLLSAFVVGVRSWQTRGVRLVVGRER